MAYSFHDELVKLTRKHEDESEDDEEEEEEGLIAMVPMADMLNHKTGYNNARLFHESDSLQMKAIKDIEKDEQIYNTYGELCNADLLRKYGFADENNPFDIVELDGTLVVNECCPKDNKKTKEKKVKTTLLFLHLSLYLT
jgi:SET domain-containing protein 6